MDERDMTPFATLHALHADERAGVGDTRLYMEFVTH